LNGAIAVHARDEYRIFDPKVLGTFGGSGAPSFDRCPFLAGDPNDLKAFSTESSLKLAEVRDRFGARLAPTSPEVQEDQIRVDIVKRDHFSVETRKLKIHEKAG
jgi:hypothetical protein